MKPEQHVFSWGAPLSPIIPYLERQDPVRVVTHLDRLIDGYRLEDIRTDARLEEETIGFLTGTPQGQRINVHLHRDDERRQYLEKLAKEKRENPPGLISETMKEVNALPSFLSGPLARRLAYFRRMQEDARRKGLKDKRAFCADRFARQGIPARLRRIEQVNARFAPLSFQAAAVRERLDELLSLPSLNRDRIQRLATLVAGVFATALDAAFEHALTESRKGGKSRKGNRKKTDEAFIWLLAYQEVGRRALTLGVTPPYWSALELRPDRRTEPDITKVPGAVLRLSDATWWNNQLRRMRDVWREELLRAAGLVSRKTSVYVSHEALLDFREKRQRTIDFLKAWDIENEDGERFSLEDVYWAGTANPRNRRNEMMVCVKGMEQIAEARGDVSFFVTVTTPSRFHSVNEDGTLNPKYCGATVKDASDYLVYTFFAAVRKAIKKAGLAWYGIRTVEPHHDGTPHWHMLVFTRPEDAERITDIMRNVAIREDRAELGDDITPRFKCVKTDPAVGTPTSYIATYIGKNLDATAFNDNDPKTGKPYTDNESGKPMADSVENAVAWARLHHIRQFQFFGVPSRQVWRELRRLAGQLARNPQSDGTLEDPETDALMAAADVGCFATYIMRQGGVLIPRSEYLARTAYVTAEEANDYGEFPERIYGIRIPSLGEKGIICTHPDEWKLVRRKPEQEDSARENGFDLQGDPVAPWTRGNNCRHDEKTTSNSTQTGQSEWAKLPPLPPSPDGFVDWFKSLRRPERKNLQRLLKKHTEESRQSASGGTGTPADAIRVEVVLPELPEIAQIRRVLEALGADFPEAMAHSVFMGARVRPGDGRTVHRDAQTGRITITPAQPEVNP